MRVTLHRQRRRAHEADDVWEGESLLYVLRERLGLPGSKNACEQGECGSCTVLPRRRRWCAPASCSPPAGRGPRGRHRRGARRPASELAPGAAGVRRRRRRAVRLLHPGPGRRRPRPAARDPAPDRRRDPRGARRQPVPLHRLREDHRRRPAGRRPDGRRHERRRTARRPATSRTDRRRAAAASATASARRDGVPKVTGEFAYSSDLCAEGMLWGAHAALPAPVGAASVASTSRAALAIPGVHAVLTARRRARPSRRYGLEIADQPVLASDSVRYQGEPVALVAADHPETARRARAADRGRRTRSLEPLTDAEAAMAPGRRRRSTPTATSCRHVPHPRAATRRPTGRRRRRGRVRGRHAGPGVPRPRVRRWPCPTEDGGVDLYVATQWLHVDREQIARVPRPARRRRCG